MARPWWRSRPGEKDNTREKDARREKGINMKDYYAEGTYVEKKEIEGWKPGQSDSEKFVSSSTSMSEQEEELWRWEI